MGHSTRAVAHRLFLIVAAVCPTVACEGIDLHFAGSPVDVGVSGTSTSTVDTLSVSDGRYGLEGIEWGEGAAFSSNFDRPCFLRATFRELNDAIDGEDTEHTVTRSVNVCNNNNYSSASLLNPRLRFSRTAYATGNAEDWHLFVSELQTCDSSASGNDRIKGIQLWGASPFGISVPDPSLFECTSSAGGAVVSGPCSEAEVWSSTQQRPNCGTWNGLVSCPAGTIASALDVHSTGNEIVGLGLTCDTVLTTDE